MVLRFSILAAAFLLSCTGIERDSVCDEKSIKYNGCAGGVSSGSTQTEIVPGPDVDYGDKIYHSVVIGHQTWMTQNLFRQKVGVGFCPPGGICESDEVITFSGKCYNNDESKCTIYGGLFDWATAMGFPSSCNSNSCASRISSNHKGICPDGWHIPSDADWDELITAVGGKNTAGRFLKSTSDWNSGGNGNDKYGFSALPGGHGNSDGSFGGVGDYGLWWSSSEDNASHAYLRRMYYNNENVNYDANYSKSGLYSVRCLQN